MSRRRRLLLRMHAPVRALHRARKLTSAQAAGLARLPEESLLSRAQLDDIFGTAPQRRVMAARRVP